MFLWHRLSNNMGLSPPRHRLKPNSSQCRPSCLLLKKVRLLVLIPSMSTVPPIKLCLYILEKPRTITLNCQPPQTPAQGICPTPLVQDYFVGGQANSVVLTQGLNGEPLRFPLHLFYSPVSLSTGAPINRAIYRITSGAAPKAWCGAVVVLKFNGSRRQGYSDAGTNDLPALSAYFLAYK